MLAVVEHIEPDRLVALVGEIHRVLRPGGLYILTTPTAWTDGLLRLMARLKMVNPVLVAEHKDTYIPAKVARILQLGGFDAVSVQTGYFEMCVNIWATATKTTA